MLTRKNVPLIFFAVFGFIALLTTVAIAFQSTTVRADTTFNEQTQTQNYQYFTFFNATTTTATSTNDSNGGMLKIAGAKKVELYFSRGDTNGQGNVGQSKFRIQVTPDGINWFDYSKLVGSDVSATATSTVTITAATSTVVTNMDIVKDAFYGVRCIVVEATDGQHTCKGAVEF